MQPDQLVDLSDDLSDSGTLVIPGITDAVVFRNHPIGTRRDKIYDLHNITNAHWNNHPDDDYDIDDAFNQDPNVQNEKVPTHMGRAMAMLLVFMADEINAVPDANGQNPGVANITNVNGGHDAAQEILTWVQWYIDQTNNNGAFDFIGQARLDLTALYLQINNANPLVLNQLTLPQLNQGANIGIGEEAIDFRGLLWLVQKGLGNAEHHQNAPATNAYNAVQQIIDQVNQDWDDVVVTLKNLYDAKQLQVGGQRNTLNGLQGQQQVQAQNLNLDAQITQQENDLDAIDQWSQQRVANLNNYVPLTQQEQQDLVAHTQTLQNMNPVQFPAPQVVPPLTFLQMPVKQQVEHLRNERNLRKF